MKRNSVYHVFLEEDIEEGKIKRTRHSFLCDPNNKASWGYSENKKEEVPTCKACLKFLQRWKVKK